ncbi:MAG: SpaH/EbpB family LPXTG-anchored major pilin [Lachnospiraceae bacterium]
MRKIIKKKGFLITLLVVLIMSSFPLVASAATGTLNVHKLNSIGVAEADKEAGKTYAEVDNLFYEYLAGATYSVYKIGTFSQTTVTTTPSATPTPSETPTTTPTATPAPSYSVNVTYTPVAGLETNDAVPVPITVLNSSTDPKKISTSNLTAIDTQTTTATGALVFTGLDENGVYLVVEDEAPDGVNASTNFIVTVPMYNEVSGAWETTIDAYPKNIFADASIEKSIVSSNLENNGDNVYYANVGDVIDYEVKVKVPNDIEAATYTKFEIVDTPSEYLEIQDVTNLVIAVDPASGAADFNLTQADGDFTATLANNVLTITLTTQGIGKLENADTLTITYAAEILPGASTEKLGLSNDVVLNLETTDNTPDPITPDDEVPKVLIYSYGIKKVDEDAEALAGATFVVARYVGENSYVYLTYNAATQVWADAADIDAATTFTTSTSGSDLNSEAILQFYNLAKDTTYYLFEKTAPTDYTKLPNPVEITVNMASTDKAYSAYTTTLAGDVVTTVYVANTGYTTTITNLKSTDNPGILPQTGDRGIYIFVIAGLASIGVAVGLLIYSKKRKKTK